MAQLVIFISPKNINPTFAEFRNYKTPRLKERGCKRVINLAAYDPKTNYTQLAQDICHDAGDKYYGHELQ